ncbi:hypothetical protein EG68_07548 [Paragonimus skrjabini miyazakii]|uniref:Uncharacterized protein n=1 Tax=Paragonimus skrjabini miyazakii TaxID=59628 RepID=A0A8S9YUG4_9TREM|nr:hypothetical protein EG68_07548 [Paragonimus skrjabini miyazakii]
MVHLKCSFILWSIAANVIIQMPCTKQPLSFGQNCSLTCHCLENVCDADTEGVGCSSGSCSPGYTGFPACQKPCDSGTFGVNCSSRCNCEPINICSPTNGNCLAPNKCSRFNYGPGCQGIRAYSLVAPSVHTDCANIIISWSGVSKTNYSGSPNIARYVVLYRSTEMNELDQINPPINVHSSSEYNYTFVPTSRKTKFIFHIRPDFYVSVPPGSYIETGVPTPPSPPFASECSGELCDVILL